MGEYHDLYLTIDVLLLADIFENFRETCLKYYKLDPQHYLSSPSLAWDASLKNKGVYLDQIIEENIDQLLFFERGKRGGITNIAHREAKANNKYLSDYNPNKKSTYLIYLDANNLYGWAMSEPLPYGGFRWLEDFPENKMLPKVEGKGRFYEVDLEYPKELHDLHNDYPCAPESMHITNDMLSEYCHELKDQFNISDSKVKKLMTTLNDKKNYVVHERLLEYYLELGLKFKKVHKVIEFFEKPWLKDYIQFNTDMRTNAKTDFEKDFFKLMNNSVYGKTMKDARKRCSVYLETDHEHFLKQTKTPYYAGCKIFSEDLVAVNMRKKEVKIDKPIYCGVAILELSKLLMYKFHYGTIKKLYGDKAKLLFTDTDSLMYKIETEDVYEDLLQFRHQLDNHKYPDDKFKFTENKQVIGKFKDETAGMPIKNFIGLKSK